MKRRDVRGKIYKNVRSAHGKIVNKPQDDINYFDSNMKMYKKDRFLYFYLSFFLCPAICDIDLIPSRTYLSQLSELLVVILDMVERGCTRKSIRVRNCMTKEF